MKRFKRLLSMILVIALAVGAVPVQAFAVEERVYFLPEIPIGEDILAHDVFYLAASKASVPENRGGVYLLRVGRGGPAESESTALVKIADLTALLAELLPCRSRGGLVAQLRLREPRLYAGSLRGKEKREQVRVQSVPVREQRPCHASQRSVQLRQQRISQQRLFPI